MCQILYTKHICRHKEEIIGHEKYCEFGQPEDSCPEPLKLYRFELITCPRCHAEDDFADQLPWDAMLVGTNSQPSKTVPTTPSDTLARPEPRASRVVAQQHPSKHLRSHWLSRILRALHLLSKKTNHDADENAVGLVEDIEEAVSIPPFPPTDPPPPYELSEKQHAESGNQPLMPGTQSPNISLDHWGAEMVDSENEDAAGVQKSRQAPPAYDPCDTIDFIDYQQEIWADRYFIQNPTNAASRAAYKHCKFLVEVFTPVLNKAMQIQKRHYDLNDEIIFKPLQKQRLLMNRWCQRARHRLSRALVLESKLSWEIKLGSLGRSEKKVKCEESLRKIHRISWVALSPDKIELLQEKAELMMDRISNVAALEL